MHRYSVPRRVYQIFGLLAVLLVAGGPLAAQRGHLTVSRNLDFLVSQAATIVEGSVIGWSVAKHERFTNLDILSVTIRVKDVLKGEAGETLTFRQHIADIRDRWNGAGYRKGQKVLLLINKVNRYGLTSTSGVQQGRFRIQRDAQQREFAVNGQANAGLFEGMEQSLKDKGITFSPELSQRVNESRAGPVPLDELRSLIRTLAGGN